jgi:AraC family transcriptional regulator of adaptative response / DNA-3-methyladenine glycosylase II
MDDADRALYAAFTSKDPRFDGRFFVGVVSTGVYCRPICRARLPKAENCSFFATAAAAERAGFRPCLLCRPELAPGSSTMDATSSLARRAALFLEENCGSGLSLDELASRLGYTDRHLRRAFEAEYHVSPVQYLQTCRLLLAKNLLTDTGLPVLEIAMATGFGSLRRFNDLFRKRYRISPTGLRRESRSAGERNGGLTLTLCYRPPYEWQRMLDFLSQRAIRGVEATRDGEYWRTVSLVDERRRRTSGWIRVGRHQTGNTLAVSMSDSLLPVLPQVQSRVRRLFDLDCSPDAICDALASMNDMRPGLCVPGTRLPGCFDPFEMAVRAILGQQITVKAAGTLAARLVEAHGLPVQTGVEGLTHVFPTPEAIVALERRGRIEDSLGPLGIIAARARAILALARMLVQGDIRLNPSAQPEAEMEKLVTIHGIGPWTAKYIAMRAMGWPDAFLETDHGVKKALAPRTTREISALAETWRPWRSYAMVNLWNSL